MSNASLKVEYAVAVAEEKVVTARYGLEAVHDDVCLLYFFSTDTALIECCCALEEVGYTTEFFEVSGVGETGVVVAYGDRASA